MIKVSNFIVKTVKYVFIVLIGIILMASILGLSELITESWLKYVIAGIIIVGIILIFTYGNSIFQKIYRLKSVLDRISVGKMFAFLFLFVLLSKVLMVFLLDNDANLHPDMQMYLSYATQIAETGIITDNIAYAVKFSYTVIYGLFLSPLVVVFGNDTKVFTIFLSFLFAIITILLFDIIRPYVGKNKAFLGMLLFNVFPVGLFETQLLVHETALLFFYILSFWLLLKAIYGEMHIIVKSLMIIVSSLLISFGTMINQGGKVVIISYFLLAIVLIFREKITWKRIVKLVLSFICVIICFLIVSSACSSFLNTHIMYTKGENEYLDRSKENRVPYSWGLYLGLNSKNPGVWNDEDRNTFDKYAEIEDPLAAKEYQINLIEDRFNDLLKNPLSIPGHLFKKFVSLWGKVFLPFSYEQGNSINDFILHGMHGVIFKAIIMIAYFVFIILCSIILLSFHNRKVHQNSSFCLPLLQFKMMIIGLTSALFLFEVMPKYVSHMQIVMFAIGIFCIDGFMDNSKRFHDRLLRKKVIKA